MPSLDRITARIAADLARMEWRLSRMRRPGVVEQYDPKTHKCRVRLGMKGDAKRGLTGWIDVEEASGAGTSRTTLTVGQPVWVNCPNGDLRLAKASAGTFSDTYRSSSQEGDETRFERGSVRAAIRPDAGELSFGETTFTVKDGKLIGHTTGTAEFT